MAKIPLSLKWKDVSLEGRNANDIIMKHVRSDRVKLISAHSSPSNNNNNCALRNYFHVRHSAQLNERNHQNKTARDS